MKRLRLFFLLLPLVLHAQTQYLPQSQTDALAAGTTPIPAIPIEHKLTDLTTLTPPPLLEIRYATKYNFTGAQLYPSPRAYLHQDAAKALQAVQQDLATQGLGLKVYDGYRPISVQRLMWNLIRDPRYVSNPDESRGRHTRGVAVDVTLVDKVGNELSMPSAFDEFSEKSHRDYKGATPEQAKNSLLLETAMTKHGFQAFPFEWWHFDFQGWEKYPPLDISFPELAAGQKTTMPVP